MSFPCIITYIVFNEGWGQYETLRVVEYAKSLDASRLFDGASGWVDFPVSFIHAQLAFLNAHLSRCIWSFLQWEDWFTFEAILAVSLPCILTASACMHCFSWCKAGMCHHEPPSEECRNVEVLNVCMHFMLGTQASQ